jgi:hypothetical protein
MHKHKEAQRAPLQQLGTIWLRRCVDAPPSSFLWTFPWAKSLAQSLFLQRSRHDAGKEQANGDGSGALRL